MCLVALVTPTSGCQGDRAGLPVAMGTGGCAKISMAGMLEVQALSALCWHHGWTSPWIPGAMFSGEVAMVISMPTNIESILRKHIL